MSNDITIKISANSKEAQKTIGDLMRQVKGDFQQVGNESKKMSRAVESSTKSIEKSYNNFLTLGGKVLALYYSLSKAVSEFEGAIQRQEQQQVFENLAASASSNAGEIVGSLKRVSRGVISEQKAIEIASKAMLLGLKPDEIVKAMEIASVSMKATGQTIEQAFNDIVTGVARQSQMILDNLGIMIDYDAALEDLASSLHKQVSQLTDAERRQAFMNATFEAGDRIVRSVGVGHKTLNEVLDAHKALLSENITNVKDTVFNGKVWLALITSINQALSFLNDEVRENNKEVSSMAQAWGLLKTVLAPAVTIYENYIRVDEEMRYSLINTKSSVEGLNEELHFYIKNIDSLAKAITKQGSDVGMSQEEIAWLTDEVKEKLMDLSRQVYYGLKTEEEANLAIQEMINNRIKYEEELTRAKKREAEERERIEKELVKEQKRLAEEQVRVEKEQAEKRKRLDNELLNMRITNYKNALGELKNTLGEGERRYKEYRDLVLSIENDIRDARQTTEERIQSLQDKFLSSSARTTKNAGRADETLSAAKKSIDKGDLDAALELARKAQEAFFDVGDSAKSAGSTFQGTTTNIVQWAQDGVAKAGEIIKEALEKQKEKAQEVADSQKTMNDDLISKMEEIEGKIQELTSEKKAIELEITLDDLKAMERLAEIRKDTSSTHTVYVKTVQTQQSGGPIRAQTGRYFPGYGGGDRIPILGEAGEYMNRKEAVNYWGVGLFDALNRIDVATVMNSLGAKKFAAGGPLSPSANGPGGGTVNVDLKLGDSIYNMQAQKGVAENLVEKIRKTNILRGRYKTPY